MINDDTVVTEQADCKFRVSEVGAPELQSWIVVEATLPTIGADTFLGFELRPGTTHEEAKRVAQYLNDRIAQVTLTKFIKPIGQQRPF